MTTRNGTVAHTTGQSPAELVIARLTAAGFDPSPAGDGEWESRCPGHNGSRRNLKVTEGDDGSALLHCHHQPNCNVAAILQAIGLELKDLFPPASRVTPRKNKAKGGKTPAKPKAPAKPKGNVFPTARAAIKWLCDKEGWTAKGYPYPDLSGDPPIRFIVFRLDRQGAEGPEKTYRPVHLDSETKGWRFGDPDGLLPLFGLPELLTADRVWFVEGEKCALIVKGLGLTSTTTAHGAKTPHKTDFAPLAGKDLVILPDVGDAGEGYLENLRALLAKLDPQPRVKVLRLPGLTEDGDDVEQWAAARAGQTPEQLRAELEEIADLLPEAGLEAAAEPRADLPEIEVNTKRHEVVAQAVEALARDPEIYKRGDALVEVIEEERDLVPLTGKTSITNVAGSPRIVALSDAIVGCALTRNASFYAWRTDREGESKAVDVAPAEWLIKAVATQRRWPGFRRLEGIAECPFPRPDGSIVEAPGYDADTGIFYRPSVAFLPVPEHPTQEDAKAAWERIEKSIEQFPFRTDDDKAVWLSGLLTVMIRPGFPYPVPGHAVVGNKAGLGKGLWIDVIAIVATGRRCPTSRYPDDSVEAHKVKLAVALAGKMLIHFDNLEAGSVYGNSGIDSALTSMTVDDRILGTSKMTGEIPFRAACFLSGNNVVPGKDAHRRWLPCNLETPHERPEERDDIKIKDLRAHILEHRAELVRDALTILRAHRLAEQPNGKWGPLGSFEQWDRLVRVAVWFATDRDCCKTRRTAADESPDRQNKIALMEGWRELPGAESSGVTTAKAIELAMPEPAKGLEPAKPSAFPTLYNALLQYGRDGKPATARSVGNLIRGMKRTNINGMMFVEGEKEHQAILWKVVNSDAKRPPSQNGGESGDSGESDSYPTPASLHTDHDVNAHSGVCEDGGETHSTDSPDSPGALEADDIDWSVN